MRLAELFEQARTVTIAANRHDPKSRILVGITVGSSTSRATGRFGPFRAQFSRMIRWIIGPCFILPLCGVIAGTTPLTLKDVSLMLRSGYSSDAVVKELAEKKFAAAFDQTMETELVKAGASQSLIDVFRSGVYQLSPEEIASAKTRAANQNRSEANSVAPITNSGQAVSQSGVPQTPAPAQQGGAMYDHLKDDLVYWHEGSLVPFDNEALERKKLYLLFFSAIWSKEGRQFTSQLADYYNRVHPQHSDFEIVFFSADRSEFAMQNYVSQTNMPWPIVAYDKLQGKAGALAGAFTHKIPRLILAEASGRVLSDSGESQPNFDKVLTDLDKLLAVSN